MSAVISETSQDRHEGKCRMTKHERHIPMLTSHNLRSLAGIKTSRGRIISAQKLFRSDSITGLCASDVERLDALQLKVVTDFRSEAEEKNEPHRLTSRDIELIHRPIPLMGNNGQDDLLKVLRQVNSEREMTLWLEGLYQSLIIDFSDVYAGWLKSLLCDDSYPQLYHAQQVRIVPVLQQHYC